MGASVTPTTFSAEFRVVMAGEPSPTDAAAAPSRSIVLRAPHGDVDWTIIELQGSIEPRSGVTSLDGIEFGTLVHEEGDKPALVMGKMQLEGELVKLKKPLAIMSMVKPQDGSTEYHVAGVVRSKVVFKTRPVPVLAKVAAAAAAASSSVCGTKRVRPIELEGAA